MYNKVYEKKEFIIFQVKNGYIAYNTKKAFKDGHTHMKCFKSAKTVIDLVIRKKVPRSTDLYYLTSLIRLSEDLSYINKIEELIKYREENIKMKKYSNNKIKILKRSKVDPLSRTLEKKGAKPPLKADF